MPPPRALLSFALVAVASADKVSLARHFEAHHSVRQHAPPQAPSPSGGVSATLALDGVVVDSSAVWANYSLAAPHWAGEKTSYALWGGQNYASLMWGSSPNYIADYACQGGYIAEKVLALSVTGNGSAGGGGDVDPSVGALAVQLLSLPVNGDGRPWEAQNVEWHVGHQGAWEQGGEALIMLRMYAAHVGDVALFTNAPDRLLCTSADGGATWTLAVPHPGLTSAVCTSAPQTLPTPLAAYQSTGALFYDAPCAPHTGSAVNAAGTPVYNSGRALVQSFTLTSPATHLSLPLLNKNRGAAQAWWSNVTVYDSESGEEVRFSALHPAASDPFGDTWTAVAVGGPGGAPLPPSRYTVVLAAEDAPPLPLKPEASYYTSPGWLTYMRPVAPGGASQLVYGASILWTRNASAPPSPASPPPPLLRTALPDLPSALGVEFRRARQALGAGRSLADYASVTLSWCLALMGQVVGVGGGAGDPDPSPLPYDVFVIPDPLYRGSLEESVNTGCSYYDVLRIGFASSYISLRVLEGVMAYAELQAGGFLPTTCSCGSSVGVDNGELLVTGATPCYTLEDVTAIITRVREAVGDRFSDPTTGRVVDWYGCSCLGKDGAVVSDCGLQDVHAGAVPPSNTCLNTVVADFLPSAALMAKLGVPAGGRNATATASWLEHVTAVGRAGSSYGPGWWHTNLQGIEWTSAHTLSADSGWALWDGGYPLRSVNNTGDWHMFDPAGIAGGLPTGYGNWPTNAENGGKFFTTAAMLWEARSPVLAGGAVTPPPPPATTPLPTLYPAMFEDWARLVNRTGAIGVQLAVNDTSLPLLAGDRPFLSTPVTDGTIFTLCATVRAKFGYPNTTDYWGDRLCDYYQDVGWGTPENGVAFYAWAKGMLALAVQPGGVLRLLGHATVVPSTGMRTPWGVTAVLPAGWPAEVVGVGVSHLAVKGTSVDVACAVGGGGEGQLACVVSVT